MAKSTRKDRARSTNAMRTTLSGPNANRELGSGSASDNQTAPWLQGGDGRREGSTFASFLKEQAAATEAAAKAEALRKRQTKTLKSLRPAYREFNNYVRNTAGLTGSTNTALGKHRDNVKARVERLKEKIG